MQQTYLHIYREVICYMLNFSGSINPLLIPIQINLYAILTQVDFFYFHCVYGPITKHLLFI